MANKTCVVTSPDSKIGEDEFRKLTSTDSGKVYQVDTDGTVKLKSLTDQFVEKTSTGEVKIENEIKFDNEVKIESKNGTAINTNNDIIELKCSDIILGTPELQLLDLQLPNDNIALSLIGGDELASSPSLSLIGNLSTTDAGDFKLTAANATKSVSLIGKPDGTLTWNGSEVATSANVLPLSGGTMTGSIVAPAADNTPVIVNSANNKIMYILGGATPQTGSAIALCGTGIGEFKGCFLLQASTSEDAYCNLVGTPSGDIYWSVNGGDAKEFVFKNMDNNTSINTIYGGTNENNGASLKLYGESTTEDAGCFKLEAKNDAISLFSPSVLTGTTAGFLTWKIGEYDAQEVMFKTTTKWMEGGQNGFYACKSSLDGAYIFAYGINSTGNEGQFILGATDKTTKSHVELIGKPDGNLTWNGNNVATTDTVLPLAGGTMTGSIIAPVDNTIPVIVNADDTHTLKLYGGTSSTDGASIELIGKGATDTPSYNKGAVILTANNGSNTTKLSMSASGMLQLQRKTGSAMRVAFANQSTNNGYNQFLGGVTSEYGASLTLNGNGSSETGGFNLKAATSISDYCSLIGKVDGTLTWNDNDISGKLTSDNPTLESGVSGYCSVDKVGRQCILKIDNLKSTSSATSGNILFMKLPSGFYPAGDFYGTIADLNGKSYIVYIGSSGEVRIYNYSTANTLMWGNVTYNTS